MKKILTSTVIISLCLSITLIAQGQDTTYTYEYDCLDCGNFETYSVSPIELSTSSAISTEILADTSTTTLAEFSFTSTRKKNPTQQEIEINEKLLFNVYPNPTTDKFYINFEVENTVTANVMLFDVRGVEIFEKKYQLEPGMNIFENPILNISSGLYLISYNTKYKFGSKRLLISKL